jgi:hypothetical protein
MSAPTLQKLYAAGAFNNPIVDGKSAKEIINAVFLRDWAFRVLDAWRAQRKGRYVVDDESRTGGAWLCQAWEPAAELPTECSGKTPDSARLAAADAVWPELPESVRAELGERP